MEKKTFIMKPCLWIPMWIPEEATNMHQTKRTRRANLPPPLRPHRPLLLLRTRNKYYCARVMIKVKYKMSCQSKNHLLDSMNSKTLSTNLSGCSSCGIWPQLSKTTNCALGIDFTSRFELVTGTSRSFAPCTTSTCTSFLIHTSLSLSACNMVLSGCKN